MAHHKASCFQRTWLPDSTILGMQRSVLLWIVLSHLKMQLHFQYLSAWIISNGARTLAARTGAQATVLWASAIHICVVDNHTLEKHLINVWMWNSVFQCWFCSLLTYTEHNIDEGFELTQSGENLKSTVLWALRNVLNSSCILGL